MSILASDIFTAVRSQLDDDNSGRYSEAADLVPAINTAIDYLVTVFNAAFEQKKLSPEVLRELTRTVILDTTGTGTTKKADVSSLMSTLWTIFGVEPDPEVGGTPELMVMTRNRLATRLSIEAWNDASLDPFSPGTLQTIPSDFIRPSYIGPARYFSDTLYHILIRPASVFVADKVGIWYLKNPTRVTTGSSSIEFPASLYNLLINKTINQISRQHATDSKFYQITDKEITQLVGLMLS